MCGILVHNKEFLPPYDLKHRGIKSSSVDFNNLILNHWSLPLQSDGSNLDQPLFIKKDLILLYNGEIFNYKDFGDYNNDLEYLMEFFSDKNWIKNPEIKKWDGFWAIVLLDKDRLYCFTDMLGKKQLYYNELGVCSEVKPLLRGLGLNSLLLGLGLGYNYFKGIKRMRPNYIYSFKIRKSGNLERKKIFPTLFSIGKTDEEDLYKLIHKSIERRLVNKIDNVTLFISGGLDSTIVLHHLIEKEVKNLEFLSIDNNENIFLEDLEEFYGINIHRIKPTNLSWGKLAFILENPYDYGSSIPQYLLFKKSKNHVILTGDGADELFGGYRRSLERDSQVYDVFTELPYLHHLRIDRLSMFFTKECRNPFLSTEIINYALHLKRDLRTDKRILKIFYKNKIPDSILNRTKQPLRFQDKEESNKKLMKAFWQEFKYL